MQEFVAFLETKSAIEAATGDRATAFESLLAAAQELRSTDADFQRGVAQCDRLDALASTDVQRVRSLLERGLLHTWVREPRQAADILRRALAELEASAIRDEALAAEVHNALGIALQQGGRTHDALTHLRAALGWFDHHADRHARAQAHGDLACVLDNLGRLDEALIHHRIALDQMRAAGDANNLHVACGNLACNRIDAGDLAAADAALLQGQRIIASHEGLDGGLPQLQVLRALVLCHLGRYGDALSQAEQCVESSGRSLPALLPRVRLRQAQCWWHLGQWARVAQALQAIELGEDGDLLAMVMHARLQLAYARAHSGGGGAAATASARLRKLCERLRAEGERPDLSLMLRIELAADEEPAVALAELAQVAQEARRIGHLGTARAAHLRAAALATPHDAAVARREARAALALADDGCIDTITLPAELWLHAGRALAAAGDASAASVIERGRRWLVDTAANQVPESYRDSFLNRNPVNRDLLTFASRMTSH